MRRSRFGLQKPSPNPAHRQVPVSFDVRRHKIPPCARVLTCANIDSVKYEIEYFNPRILATIEAWPTDILADYAKLVELLLEHGPNLRMPHSRSLGDGLFELRPRGREGIGRTLYCFLVGKRVSVVHAFIKKTEQTPEQDLKIARKRVKVLKNV